MSGTGPGRIPCLNPVCRRTAPRSRHEDSTEIICGKCWRKLPRPLRDRYKELNARERRTLRKVERRVAAETIDRETVERIAANFERSRNENWSAIRRYFTAPETPVGLEGFLQEMGL